MVLDPYLEKYGVPTYLRNMLKVCGYTTKYSFINFSKEDVTIIEEFARNVLPCIYKNIDMDNKPILSDLYGPFKYHPVDFKILPGFSNQLFTLSHCISQGII